MKKLVFLCLTIIVMIFSNFTSHRAHADAGACITCPELGCSGGKVDCATATCRGHSYTCYTEGATVQEDKPQVN